MSGRRRKKSHHEGGHEGPDERWMASYMDMVTVLMCMFIVLFAMSTVSDEKYQALKDSLGEGFGQHQSEELTAVEGIVVPKEFLEGDSVEEAELQKAIEEYEDLAELREQLEKVLDDNKLPGVATFTLDERGLTIGLVSSETFFATNSTNLSSKAVAILKTVGPVLKKEGRALSIEGHADYRNPSGLYPTNWELSSARATGVLRHLVEREGIKDTLIKSVGFGSAHPITKGTDAKSLAKNRRVDIVILSDEEERVRALLPDIDKVNPAKGEDKTSGSGH
jgi:Flagellar motor protein